MTETYGRGTGVGRALGVGLNLTVGSGVGVGVPVAVAVGVVVAVAVAVAVGVDVAIGVGVGERHGTTPMNLPGAVGKTLRGLLRRRCCSMYRSQRPCRCRSSPPKRGCRPGSLPRPRG
jgi:hypothetical protein